MHSLCIQIALLPSSVEVIKRKYQSLELRPISTKIQVHLLLKIKHQLIFIIGKVFYYGIAKILMVIETAIFLGELHYDYLL